MNTLLTGKRVNLSEMYTRDALVGGLGTAWVAPGEGSTWRELWTALGRPSRAYASEVTHRRIHLDHKTNLLLTGAPIQPYDRERWESGNVR